jgi:alanyl aminopeptidase
MIAILRFAVAALLLVSLTAVAAPPSSAGGTAGTPKPPALRLDKSVRPLRYAARITVDPAQPSFKGSIDIDLTLGAATDLVWLHATDLVVAKAAFTVAGASLPARVVPGGEDFLGFAPPEGKSLPAGAARLHVEWKGKISRKDDRGLFGQKEGERWYAITQFESIFARRVFPCFDEPGIKVPWQLTLELPKALVALSNTHPVAEKSEHPGMKTVTFAETAPLPTYLVAFAVGPDQLVDSGKAGPKHTAVRVAAPFARGKDAAYAASVSAKIVELLEQYFDIPFPYEKLDAVTVPLTTSFGAMENPGMVTFAQGLLVAKPTNRGIWFEREYAEVAAHEFAHQWFGDLVTTAWWDDIWLNESFADWMEAKIVDEWHPEWSHKTSYVEGRAKALGADSLMTARQIRQPIVSNDDIYNAFDAITYEKGMSVLRMFERFVGADKFRAGIHSYLLAHKNGNATADDFVSAISAAAGRDVSPAFKTFLDQPGAPMVDVSLSCAVGKPPTLALSQRRFVPVGSKGSAEQLWQIPFCVRWIAGDKTERACTMMTQPKQTMTLGTAAVCPSWLLANDEEVGYYRAAYSADLLGKLLGADGRKKLELPETVGLLDDVRALVRAGRMPLGDALALTPSLAEDPRRLVAEKVVGVVAGLHDHLVPPALKPNYVRYIQKLYGDKARALGWSAKPGEDEDTRLLREEVVGLVADEGEDATLRTEARTLALKWIGDRKAVSPDVVETVLDVAARTGDRALFDKIHAEARRATDRQDRHMLIRAMGRFRDPALAKAALGVVAGDEFDAREAMAIVWSLTGDAATRPQVWDFVKSNFDTMVKRLSDEQMAHAPYFAVAFCDEPHQRDMAEFFRDRSPKLPGGPRVLAQAQEQIGLCRAYVAAQQASVTSFLQKW